MTLRTILEEALAKETPSQARQYLEEALGEPSASVQDLLRQIQAILPIADTKPGETKDFLLQVTPKPAGSDVPPLPEPVVTPDPPLGPAAEPTFFSGKYRLRERLGVGGMGEVYAAEQVEPLRRRVAIKVIRQGMNSSQVLGRFEQERQALALMEHPNIAKVYDGGTSPDGQPYFVMEHVKGLPITKYCDQEKLSPRERLALFLPVCQAVQHAHQKGIIHRDLKPSNILVGLVDGQPVPKVIDFGVAKALHGPIVDISVYTELNTIIGTLEYMSPEQAELNNLDIDTRTDIYSLGVVLYELLAGVLPFSRREQLQGALDAILKIIREVEPAKPSTKVSTLKELPDIASRRKLDPQRLTRVLAGELDWIVLKCLEKERDRRYPTAAALAADLERYLRDEPVLAAPASRAYRARKFLRRHWGKATIAACMLLLLLGGIVATSVGMWQARQAERQAEQEAQVQRALLEFIDKDIFLALDPTERPGLGLSWENEIRVRTLLDRAARQLGAGRFAQQPQVEAPMRLTIGKAFKAIGAYESARQQLMRAEQLYATFLDEPHPQRLEVLEALGQTLGNLGRYEQASPLCLRLVRLREDALGAGHVKTLSARYLLASLYQVQGQEEKARDLLTLLLTDQQRHLGPEHADTLQTITQLAGLALAQGPSAAAETQLQEVIRCFERTAGKDHPVAIAAMNTLAKSYHDREEYEQAEQLYRQIIASAGNEFGLDHPCLMVFKNNLAACLIGRKQHDQAFPLLQEALPVFNRIDPEHYYTLVLRRNMALVHLDRRDYPRAVAELEEILPIFRRKLGPTRPETLELQNHLSDAYYGAGRLEKGLTTAQELLAVMMRQPSEADHLKLRVDAVRRVCKGLVMKKQHAETERLLRQQMDLVPKDHPQYKRLEKYLKELQQATKGLRSS